MSNLICLFVKLKQYWEIVLDSCKQERSCHRLEM